MIKIGDLGERRTIEKIIKNLQKSPKMKMPFGDDVAAISLNARTLAVLKTDMLVGETDIPPGMTLRQAARKAVIMNISDFAAKGVKPEAVLTSLGLPRSTTETEIDEISHGLSDGVEEYNTYIVGGDTGESSCLIICCMVFGTSHPKNLITRSGAKPGDLLAVTGPFGKTSVGLKILLENLKTVGEEKNMLDAVYMPKARLNEGLALSRTGAVSASIDSSDGLAVSLYELQKMSKVGFSITKVPVSKEVVKFANRNDLDPEELALYGGEEYELILTINPKDSDRAQQAAHVAGTNLIEIGCVTENQDIVLSVSGVEKKISYRGWEHFK